MPRTYPVTLTFHLLEPVTPDYLAKRVAQACANQYAIREGEGVSAEGGPTHTFLRTRTPEEQRRHVAGLFRHEEELRG